MAKGVEKDRSLITCGKPNNYTREQLSDLNNKGAGIYFTPNSFPEGIRRAEKCKGVNAWIVENDKLSIDDQWKNLKNAPLKPSFVVQTKNSLHAYWLAKKGTIENYTKIIKGLIGYFNGDPACKDISRVFRVPGFLHQKDRNNPVMIGLIEEQPQNRYTEEQMATAFPEPAEEKKTSLIIQKIVKTNDFWEMLGNLDNKSVLIRLSGQPIVKGEIIEFKKRRPTGEYIYVNGQMCDGWLDDQGMIGSGKQGGPTWIQWLGFYGVSKSEIARWAKDNLSEVKEWMLEHEPPKEIIIKRQVENIGKERTKKDYKLRYTWGTRGLDVNLAIIKRGNFIVAAAKRNSGKTTFTFNMAYENAKKGHKVLYLSLEMDEDEIKEMFARSYAQITIEEELDYKIPEYKKKKFDDKIKQIDSIENLYLKSIRRGKNILWETILQVISEFDNLDLIFIDNLDLIAGESRESDLDRQKRIVSSIMSFTSDKQIPVILIHHYRKSLGGKDKGMDEMSGSGKIGDGADRVIKILRNSDALALYPEKFETKIFLQKGRGYPECFKNVYFIRGDFVDEPPTWEEYNNQPATDCLNIDSIAEAFGGEIIPSF
ncbi:MAG: DnaB-like helicase C-terminal domain-containing protein [bacterium]